MKTSSAVLAGLLLPLTAVATPAPTPVSSVVAPVVVTSLWQGCTEKDGTGLYFQALNRAFGKDRFPIQFRPWKRAQLDFAKGQGDILLGEDGFRKWLYPKWPIDVNFYSVAYNPKKVKKADSNSLKDAKLVWIRGYDVNVPYPEFKQFVEVTDFDQAARMLAKHRVDAWIDFETDMANNPILKRGVASGDLKFERLSLKAGWLWAAFRDTDSGRALAKRFDEAMDEIDRSGELKKEFEKLDQISSYEAIKSYMATRK